MLAGGVAEDARDDEDHGRERDHVRDVLVRPVARVLVRRRRQAHDHVCDDGGGHDRQADAAEERKPSKLPLDRPSRFYH